MDCWITIKHMYPHSLHLEHPWTEIKHLSQHTLQMPLIGTIIFLTHVLGLLHIKTVQFFSHFRLLGIELIIIVQVKWKKIHGINVKINVTLKLFHFNGSVSREV